MPVSSGKLYLHRAHARLVLVHANGRTFMND